MSITPAQRLIDIFEWAHPEATVYKQDLADLARSLGGKPEVVLDARWDTSILAYICALTVRHIEENQPKIHMREQFPLNEGHGHVYPRPDGVVAKCGGPGLCEICSADLLQKLSRQ